MPLSIFIGGLALALGIIAIWSTQKEKRGHQLFMVYGICNIIVISLFVVMGFPSWSMDFPGTTSLRIISFFLCSLKGVLVPLLGVMAFAVIQNETTTLEDIQSIS
ncbi:MAG: hypothetical protein ACFFC7_07955 [Candidatus Hermodarchaeota archaeon]